MAKKRKQGRRDAESDGERKAAAAPERVFSSPFKDLKKMLADLDNRLTVVLELVVDEDEVVRRLSGRRTCRRCQRVWHVLYEPPAVPGVCDDCGGELFQRDDDKEEVIRHRLEVYNSQTSPLIAFYADEGILVGIDATGPVDEVTGRALSALQPYVH